MHLQIENQPAKFNENNEKKNVNWIRARTDKHFERITSAFGRRIKISSSFKAISRNPAKIMGSVSMQPISNERLFSRLQFRRGNEQCTHLFNFGF